MRRAVATALIYSAVFLLAWFMPVDTIATWAGDESAVHSAASLLREYAREHVLLCLIPALLIAGAIAVFLHKDAVMQYLGAKAKPIVAYSVASISGSILAVCSCTILPLFAGIYRMGAGVGPASTFLYAGPAINVLAIVLTARILGFEFGLARALFAITFGVIIGVLMAWFFAERRELSDDDQSKGDVAERTEGLTPNILLLVGLIGFLVFANWSSSSSDVAGMSLIAEWKWPLAFASLALATLAFLRWKWNDGPEWLASTWDLSKQILPLLLIGVVISGLLFGTAEGGGVIPRTWISTAVGGNSWTANLVAALSAALMYFATLTEIPILQGLMGQGMGEGPAMTLLLAGPAVSLPSLLVIRSIIGTKRTVVFLLLVVVLASVAGRIFGWYMTVGQLP